MNTFLPTTLVGSYPQPDWLIDRAKLAGRFPPRVRAKELWRIAPEWLEQAQDDATLLAIRDQERAGLDIITDGEMRRESYSNRFATALEGVDIDNPGTALDRSGHPNPVPRVVGRIRRRHPVQVRDVAFLRANTDRKIKITVPGAFTMAQQAQNDFYKDEIELAMDYAAAVNEEIKDLFAAGADVIQIDEPYMQARPAKAKQYGIQVLNRALDGVTGTTAVHICFDTLRSFMNDRRVTRSCLNSKARMCGKSRSKLHNRTSTAAYSRRCLQRPFCSGCWISRI
jgi:5-methyltetrahydropteroyltriglutamate--homocysteine methyltransferase